MPAFPKPKFDFRYSLDREVAALRAHRRERGLPAKSRDKLLLATWNIANLGLQKRRVKDYALLAEICSWFDLVAVQEVNDNLTGFDALRSSLPSSYNALFFDASGNQERQAFVYDSRKVRQLEKVGRISIPPTQLKKIKPPGTDSPFEGSTADPTSPPLRPAASGSCWSTSTSSSVRTSPTTCPAGRARPTPSPGGPRGGRRARTSSRRTSFRSATSTCRR